jgi:hypothetical protein
VLAAAEAGHVAGAHHQPLLAERLDLLDVLQSPGGADGGEVEAVGADGEDKAIGAAAAVDRREAQILRLDDVVARSCHDPVAARGDDPVVAIFAIESVIAGAADEGVVAEAAEQQIVAVAAFELGGIAPAENGIVARAA